MKHFGKENDRDLYGVDANKDIILMWKAIQNGWNPPSNCSKKEYEMLKSQKSHSAERGFIGVACSYGGIFFVGYRGNQTFNSNTISSSKRAKGVVTKIGQNLDNVKFSCSDYKSLCPKNMLIYVDPPYIDNKYIQSKYFQFDHEEFWNIIRIWSKNNLVVISERKAPKDFKCIWQDKRNVTQHGKVTKQTEKLFVVHELWLELDTKIKKDIKDI